MMTKADIEIGKRAFEEILRIFPSMVSAKRRLGISSNLQLYSWADGGAPSAKYLQRLHGCGADVIYILTGKRNQK